MKKRKFGREDKMINWHDKFDCNDGQDIFFKTQKGRYAFGVYFKEGKLVSIGNCDEVKITKIEFWCDWHEAIIVIDEDKRSDKSKVLWKSANELPAYDQCIYNIDKNGYQDVGTYIKEGIFYDCWCSERWSNVALWCDWQDIVNLLLETRK